MSEPGSDPTVPAILPVGRRVTTPGAAAFAGIAFSLLLGTSFVLLRLEVPQESAAPSDWIDNNGGRVKFALVLVPFAGIAFLWFIGVIRDRLGELEDRFFSSVLFGSGLLFLAMIFAATALAGAMIASYEASPDLIEPGLYTYNREVTFRIVNIFAVRMAGVFMFSSATIWLRSNTMPRWVVVLTYLLAVVQLAALSFSLWMILIFPAWVLIVSLVFLAHGRRRIVAGPNDQAPAPGHPS